jgi:hypothetical protein
MNCLTTKNFTMRKFYLMTGLWAALFTVNAQKIATFEDAELEPGTFYNGSDGNRRIF